MTLMNPGHGFCSFIFVQLGLGYFLSMEKVMQHDGKPFTKHKVKN